MSIGLQCDQCGRCYTLKDELAGKAVKCKGCGKVLRVPALPACSVARAKAPPPMPAPPPVIELDGFDRPPVAKPATPPVLDVYGLEESPVAKPATREDDHDIPPPRAGIATEKRVKDRGRERPSFVQPALGVSGTVFVLVMIFARVYFRMNREHRNRNANQVRAAAPKTPDRNEIRVGAAAPEAPGAPWRAGLNNAPRNSRPPRDVGPIVTPAFPDRGPGALLQAGVRFFEVRLGPDDPAPGLPGHRGKLWLYLPDGEHAPASLACVVITGAGSFLIDGMNLANGDRAEHLPYVPAGFAVLAYELDGAVPEKDARNNNAVFRGAKAFLAAQAGLVNARNALDFLASRAPEVDPERIYTVGHSSAGTMALVLTENEPRIKACVAFAPMVDVTKRFPSHLQIMLKLAVPGSDAFFSRYNPRTHEDAIRCPLMLFHAQDDSNVPVSESVDCHARLERLGRPVTLVTVPTGDHYDAMLRQGIPRAIDWLKGLDPAQ